MKINESCEKHMWKVNESCTHAKINESHGGKHMWKKRESYEKHVKINESFGQSRENSINYLCWEESHAKINESREKNVNLETPHK